MSKIVHFIDCFRFIDDEDPEVDQALAAEEERELTAKQVPREQESEGAKDGGSSSKEKRDDTTRTSRIYPKSSGLLPKRKSMEKNPATTTIILPRVKEVSI